MSGKITDFFKPIKNSDEQEDEEKVEENIVEKVEKPTQKKPASKKPAAKKATKKRKQTEPDEEETESEKEDKIDSAEDDKKEQEDEKVNKKQKLVKIDDCDEKAEESKTAVTSNNYYDDIESYFTDKDWKEALKGEFNKPYFKKLIKQLNSRYSSKEKPIYPPKNEIFSAFNYAHLKDVKVVIVGQDPYHGEGQAHGLSFSVKKGVSPPPSLINMYKELETDIDGFKRPLKNGCLEPWARQGVFLLNAALTVEEKSPNSHSDYGWYEFTDAVLKILNQQEQPIVFILWGGFARKKVKLFDKKKHCILESGHPSPLSVKHFLGCKHFSKANEFLKSKNIKEIDWTIDENK